MTIERVVRESTHRQLEWELDLTNMPLEVVDL